MLLRLVPVVLALTLPGCFFASEKEHRESTEGTLVVAWTIDGAKEPPMCDSSNAREFHITLEGGDRPLDLAQRCGAFGAAIDLPVGRYTGAAVLRDSKGACRTTEAHLGSFYIYGNDILTIPIDFPASSFY